MAHSLPRDTTQSRTRTASPEGPQHNHNGFTRDTRVMQISASMRYRTWRKIRLQLPGNWELPVYYENADGIELIDSINLHVSAPGNITSGEKYSLNDTL